VPRTEEKVACLEDFLRLWNRLREVTHPFAYQEIQQAGTPTMESEAELAALRQKILERLPEVQETLGKWHPDLTATATRALDSGRSLHDLVVHPEFRESFRRDWGMVQQYLARGIGEVRLEGRRSQNPLVWISRGIVVLRKSVSPKDIAWWLILTLAGWKLWDLLRPFILDFWAFLRVSLSGNFG